MTSSSLDQITVSFLKFQEGNTEPLYAADEGAHYNDDNAIAVDVKQSANFIETTNAGIRKKSL